MSDLGADVIKVKGNYESSLIECIKQSTKNNWQIIQDVAWKEYITVPKYTMAIVYFGTVIYSFQATS